MTVLGALQDELACLDAAAPILANAAAPEGSKVVLCCSYVTRLGMHSYLW